MMVDGLKGRAISSTAPIAGQALVYDGTQWVPSHVSLYVRKTADQSFASTTVASATQMAFPVAAGYTYKYRFTIAHTSSATNIGMRVAVNSPAQSMFTAQANIAAGSDGAGAYYQGVMYFSGDSVMSSTTAAASPTSILYSTVDGIVTVTAAGTVQLAVASESAANPVVVKAGSFVEYTIIP
jgi:hypothetical protein